MKWAHLPVAGGLYDQSPELLDGFLHIFGRRAEYQEEEDAKEKRQNKNK